LPFLSHPLSLPHNMLLIPLFYLPQLWAHTPRCITLHARSSMILSGFCFLLFSN
jgi:hypothetical protein